MQKLIFICSFSLILLFSCKNDPKTAEGANAVDQSIQPVDQASPKQLSGFWINTSFIQQVNNTGSVVKAINSHHKPFAYMFYFDDKNPNKVAYSDGAGGNYLDAVYRKDTIELKNAAAGKSIFLVYDSENGGKQITMFDGTGTGPTQLDQFTKSSSDLKDGNLIFANAVNYNLFGTKYLLNGKEAFIDPKGFLRGVPGWDGYQVCVSSQCFRLGAQMDVINLTNSKDKTSELFGWEYNAAKDSMAFYKLRPSANPDSVYTIVNKAFTLVRRQPKMAEPKK
jgi:hypothetical protein